MGLWKRFRQGLEKTRSALRTDIRDLFKSEGRLVDEQFLDELFGILVRTDMGGGPAGLVGPRASGQSRTPGSTLHMKGSPKKSSISTKSRFFGRLSSDIAF